MRIEGRSELLAANLKFYELMQWQLKAPEDTKRLINASIVEFSMNICAALHSFQLAIVLKWKLLQTEYDLQFDLIFSSFSVEMKSEKLAKCMYNVDGTVDDIY